MAIRRVQDPGEADDLLRFFQDVENGAGTDVRDLGRDLEQRFPEFAGQQYPPYLSGMSDVGLTRQLNEDNWGWAKLSERARLYVVADGMGGHDSGEVRRPAPSESRRRSPRRYGRPKVAT